MDKKRENLWPDPRILLHRFSRAAFTRAVEKAGKPYAHGRHLYCSERLAIVKLEKDGVVAKEPQLGEIGLPPAGSGGSSRAGIL